MNLWNGSRTGDIGDGVYGFFMWLNGRIIDNRIVVLGRSRSFFFGKDLLLFAIANGDGDYGAGKVWF